MRRPVAAGTPHPDPPHKGEGEETRLMPLKLFVLIGSADV